MWRALVWLELRRREGRHVPAAIETNVTQQQAGSAILLRRACLAVDCLQAWQLPAGGLGSGGGKRVVDSRGLTSSAAAPQLWLTALTDAAPYCTISSSYALGSRAAYNTVGTTQVKLLYCKRCHAGCAAWLEHESAAYSPTLQLA